MANQVSEPDLPTAYPVDGSLLPPPRDQHEFAVPTVMIPSTQKELAQAVGTSVSQEMWPNLVATSVITVILYVLVKLFGRRFGG